MNECEECGESVGDNTKRCFWSGLLLCGDCAYDEGIQAEDRHYGELDGDRPETAQNV